MRVLIGHTGFVGQNIGHGFDLLINSRNVEQLRGLECSQIVCCGLPGEKWRANADPDADLLATSTLIAALSYTTAQEFTLISTIDVYGNRRGDESQWTRPRDSYGAHRLAMERFVRGRWRNARIIRLPAIYGTSLRKNVLFDLLHEHRLEYVNPASRFQWFSLARLRAIIDAPGPRLLNLVTESIPTVDLLCRFFPWVTVRSLDSPVDYDVRSRFFESGYFQNRDSVLAEMAEFIEKTRNLTGILAS